MIKPELIKQSDAMIALSYEQPLKILSSAVTGGGFGMYQNIVNRYVDKDYQCDNYFDEMCAFLKKHRFNPDETVSMMTAVQLKNMQFEFVETDDFSVLIIVTAGISNAVNSTDGQVHPMAKQPGTINTWLLVNGVLSDAAYVQAVITATEAKVKALHDLKIKDALTGEQATGTSTDSVLVGATQKGAYLEFAGPITPLGAVIGRVVYQATKRAIEVNEKSHEK